MSVWKIVIEDLAQLDLQDVYEWYERKKAGLGDEFLDEFDETINKIEKNPFHASGYDDKTRSASLKRFPYEVIYLVDEYKHEVYVIAIGHQHRKPGRFLRR